MIGGATCVGKLISRLARKKNSTRILCPSPPPQIINGPSPLLNHIEKIKVAILHMNRNRNDCFVSSDMTVKFGHNSQSPDNFQL